MPKTETKPISAMMGLAITHAERAFKHDLDNIVRVGMADECEPNEGWTFDPRARSWTRQVADDTPTE